MPDDINVFSELHFKRSGLKVNNRVFRSSISGKWDYYDGTGPTEIRARWEEKFALGGVGAIITSYTPVHRSGRILTNYAMIDDDERIPDWAMVIDRVRKASKDPQNPTKFIIQLSHSGRQRDEEGVDNYLNRVRDGLQSWSCTSHKDTVHGLRCQAMTREEIRIMIAWFRQGARRAKAAGADGIETHSANGYLFNQFLSSAINDRVDEYGGELPGRARFLMEVIREIRREVGDFHFQSKISVEDYDDFIWGRFNPCAKRGNTIVQSRQVCHWAAEPMEWVKAWNEYAGRAGLQKENEADWQDIKGVDGIHVSGGSTFPHALNPPGEMPVEVLRRTYEVVTSTGADTFRNLVLLRYVPGVFRWLWDRIKPDHPGYRDASFPPLPAGDIGERLRKYQGVSLKECHDVKAYLKEKGVDIPVIVTGGYQQKSYIDHALKKDFCDGVAIARPLVANNNLLDQWRAGADLPKVPCTFCNKCLTSDIRDPLGCYEESRYNGDHKRMIETIYEIFKKARNMTN